MQTIDDRIGERQYSFTAELAARTHLSPTGKFKGYIIEGDLRVGKTSYAIKVMRDTYMILHPEATIDEAYEFALEQMHFNLGPFLDLVAEKQRHIKAMLPDIDWTTRIPICTLDDGSLYAGVSLYFTDQKLYSAFQNTMTTIGTAVSNIAITCPRIESLAKPIREFYNYHPISVTTFDEYRRKATVSKWYQYSKTGRLRKKKMCVDEFTPRIPTKHYAKYLKNRIELGEDSVNKLRDAVKEGKLAEEVAAEALRNHPDFDKLKPELEMMQKRLEREQRRRDRGELKLDKYKV